MTLLFMFLLAGTAVAITVLPMLRQSVETGEGGPVEDILRPLRRKKEIVYGNIKDLEFEFRMGKLGAADYRELRDELKREAAHVLEKMEQAQKTESTDQSLEIEIMARRSLSRSHQREGTSLLETQQAKCPQCHTPYARESKFCSECGASLTGQ